MLSKKQNTMMKFFMFFIAVANALLIFQFTNIAVAKGVNEQTALKIFSIINLAILASIYIDNHLLKYIHKKTLINTTFIIRIILLIVLIITQNPWVFGITFILYGFVYSGFDVIVESIVSLICVKEGVEYGKTRRFYSLGFSLNGVFAFILMMFFPPQQLLVFILLLNVVGWICSWSINFEVESPKHSVNKIDGKTFFLTVILMLVIVTPNLFAVNLNYHLESQYNISVQMAAFYGGLAVVIGSLISEMYGMSKVGGFIKKSGPLKIIYWAIYLSLIRWCLALVAPTPALFMCTYFLHGVSFAFAYIGGIEFINKYIDSHKVPTFVSYNTILSAVFTSGALFILSDLITNMGTQVVVIFNIFATILALVLFKIFITKYKLQGDK